MKIGRSSKTGRFITGAGRIVSAPSMDRARAKIASGSIDSDWKAVGNDLRKAMDANKDRFEVA